MQTEISNKFPKKHYNIFGSLDAFDYFTHYTYDKKRISQVQINGTYSLTTAENADAQYSYEPDGKLKRITYPKLTDGSFLTGDYAYDGKGRILKVTNKKGMILSEYQYQHDANGNISADVPDENATNFGRTIFDAGVGKWYPESSFHINWDRTVISDAYIGCAYDSQCGGFVGAAIVEIPAAYNIAKSGGSKSTGFVKGLINKKITANTKSYKDIQRKH
ncbi:hypothetical protein [Paenibacillus bouchesdurhonensis]|uniref:hypothetical protein n=1 Tax=Paenibacillus bouchesdurhonensis TaxID=1870990 RepID=UPI000DA63A7C|nr:hypothetical protein [Paenibacillus bouchesdurhonensis]